MGVESRSISCPSVAGIKKLYILPFVKYSRSQASVADNFITTFPFSALYQLAFVSGGFQEQASIVDGGEEIKQVLTFVLQGIKSEDNVIGFIKQDVRFVIETNEGELIMTGFRTGMTGGYTAKHGVTRSELKGYELTFETSEEITAPYLDNLDRFDINGENTLEEIIETIL